METTQDIALPPGYRLADVIAFHGRDAEGVAEQVSPQGLRKGVLLDGVPTLLDIRFDVDVARCRIARDGPATPALEALVQDALLNVLGLRIDPAAFAAFAHDDPVLGPMLARQPGLRIVQSATVFEALTWAIIGQQINLTFAIALRRTLIQLAGRPHSSGLWCYPEAQDVARLALEDLTSRKFSGAKAETVLRVARMVVDGSLSLERERDAAQVSQELLAVKGIGPWTVNYVLLRGYGYTDCSLEGDVAVRNALHNLTRSAQRPTLLEAQRLLARYAPHRTMAAAYLWASLAG
ncbi:MULTISPECIES: DNA-3-methyladenine glycosylase family protein [Massilia]|uniref:DNA-3-methyladenine glycosylase II n=1 Tax=Massilia aurea TaxID=373040 RepID=A0A422QNR8_9BURK|nr:MULTISPECIES: DNA-3-methyladenine glycosylase 2 [Massilia]MDY0962435.1 DNA-3-methyladenine glycosylase 2 [Massilia sp. CFBP9026]RNF31421.1 DNA repair protein [Massilia aurea]